MHRRCQKRRFSPSPSPVRVARGLGSPAVPPATLGRAEEGKKEGGRGAGNGGLSSRRRRRSRIFYCLLPGQGPSFLQRAPRLAPLAGQETIIEAESEKLTRGGRRRGGDYEDDDAKAQEKVVKVFPPLRRSRRRRSQATTRLWTAPLPNASLTPCLISFVGRSVGRSDTLCLS